MPLWAIVLLAVLAAALIAALSILSVHRRHPVVGKVEHLRDDTVLDASGAVRSVQEAIITLPSEALDALWSPMNLERLARTYWRFLTRVTLGLVRVAYEPGARHVIFLARPFRLLSFEAPEYETEADRGLVRWRIERGLLVARRGSGGRGYLEIEVRRRPAREPGKTAAQIAVEVANFYPSLASGIGNWFYKLTQSRVHVVVTYAFLRSLSRLDLAVSRVGRFAGAS
jgi:hypothetical protein